jgi:metal-responsive CopG/Arc/MetJ family transcriptional regulator
MFLPREFGEAVVVARDGVILATTAEHLSHQHCLTNAVVDVDAIKI